MNDRANQFGMVEFNVHEFVRLGFTKFKKMRSKGYCAAHYQKFRMLSRTHRLPADWTEHASPGSVRDVVLPRGRAGAKALAEARKR